MYLTRSWSTLFQLLSKKLNYSLRKEDEQKFIYLRLNLFDQQYWLEIDQHLWQSYLNIGFEKHLWPVSFLCRKSLCSTNLFVFLSLIKDELYKMAKTTTNDTKLCYEYLHNYLESIKQQLNQCQLELDKQSHSCPITSLPLNQIDDRLKKYVHAERNYLLTRNNDQLNKFKDNIYEKDLYKTIVSYGLPMNLVSTSKSFYTDTPNRFCLSIKSYSYFCFFRMNI